MATNPMGSVDAFSGCTNLTNCMGTGTSTSTSTSSGYYGHGFRSCTNLTNCIGIGSTVGSFSYAYGFGYCTNLTNCTGTATSTNSNAYGFGSCTNLTKCTGTATGGTGYGFYSCKGMVLNKPGSASTTATYNTCYVSISGSGTAPADTAAGGWNKA
jgi:hypothetical protein